MRRTEREIKDRALIEDVLAKANILYLGLVDHGEAYVVPLNFGYADGRLYFHCALEGRKVAAIKRDPRVSFTVVWEQQVVPAKLACKWSARYRSVMGTGHAVIVADDGERRRGLDSILAKFAPGPFEYDPAALARTLVIRVDIASVTGKQAGY